MKTWLSRGAFLYVALVALVGLTLLPLYAMEANGSTFDEGAERPLEVAFSLPSGPYQQDVELVMDAGDPNADVFFTVDGSLPFADNGTLYTRPLHLSPDPASAVAVRARAILPNGEMGPVTTASYWLGFDTTLPVLSLVVDPHELYNPTDGIFVWSGGKGRDWERPAELIFHDNNGLPGFQTTAGLRVHGAASRGKDKKSLRLYFRSEYGLGRLEYPLFPGDDLVSFNRLVLHSGSQEYPETNSNGTLLRNPLVTRLSAHLDTYTPLDRPVLVLLNGELWGIFNLRERVDEDFLADRFGIESGDLLGWLLDRPRALEGDLEHWLNLVEFVESHDLSEPEHYRYVRSQMDVDHFMDYNILQIYIANGDWPHNNQTRFRSRTYGGRWQWVFWDTDAGFGMAPSSFVEFNMVRKLFGEEGAGTLLLQRLMRNPSFRDAFLNRSADVLNTVLSPEQVIAHIDELEAEYGPNMPFENRRWPSVGDWFENVEYLRDYARRRPGIMRQHYVEGFGLAGTAGLEVTAAPEGGGSVAVNDRPIASLPWQGTYFSGVPLRLSAVPEPGYRFAGWQPDELPQAAVITLTLSVSQTVTPLFEPLDPNQPRPGDVVITGFGVDDGIDVDGVRYRGDWIELTVRRPGGLDLRGWRLTDNDTRQATDEGSILFNSVQALASLPQGTRILILATRSGANDIHLPADALDGRLGRLRLYAGNDALDIQTDPWFNVGPNDNLVLLAPGPTSAFGDDQGIAYQGIGTVDDAVTPGSFGILQDGVTGP